MSRLSELYYDPRQGFLSATKLLKKAKGSTLQQVRDFLADQVPYQLTKQPRRRRVYRSIVAPYRRFSFQIDLMIYDRYVFHGYKYILTCIDVFSRRAEARALTNRQAPTIKKALISIFETLGLPLNVNCDQEFVQSDVIRHFLEVNDINIYASDPEESHKNALIESFHRTLALMLQRWRQAASGLRNWTKVLPDIMWNYNHTYHTTLGCTPMEVWDGVKKSKQKPVYDLPVSFKVGDHVRLLNTQSKLAKGDALRFSKDVYEIIERLGSRFRVKNLRTQALPTRRYKEYELVKGSMPAEPVVTHRRPPVVTHHRSQKAAAAETSDYLKAGKYYEAPLPSKRALKQKKFLDL